MDFKLSQVAAICAFNGNTFDAQQMEIKEDVEHEMKMTKYLKEKEEYEKKMKEYELQMEEFIKANPNVTMEQVAHYVQNNDKPDSPQFQKRVVNPHTMIPEGLNISVKMENKRANLITKLFGL